FAGYSSHLAPRDEPKAPAPTAEGLEFFEKKVRPILSEHCYECHSIAKNSSKGSLILDSLDGMLKGGEEGPAVVPGSLDRSLLIRAVRYHDPDLAMPPKKNGGHIGDAKVAILEEWVTMGAPAPAGAGEKLTGLTDKAKKHWAYQPLAKPAIPAVKDESWARTPIDRFILAKLDAAGLVPSPAADPEALLRRMFYDLVGLPPTSEQVEAFVKAYEAAKTNDSIAARRGMKSDTAETIIARQVDALLASPHFGERWARHLLDTARYSDTRGLQVDQGESLFTDYRYAYAWTYRDYVINAFNEDKPYDQFITEQLAADRLPGVSPDDPRLAALGFLTVGRRFDNDDDTIDERIDTTTKAFLGLTVACSRCHDHKFDPIPAEDYYSLHGIFASIREPLQRPVLAASGAKQKAAREDYLRRLNQLQDEQVAGFFRYMKDVRARYDREMAGRLMVASVKRGSAEAGKYEDKYKLDQNVPDFEPMRVQKDSPVTGPFARLMEVPDIYFAERAAAALQDALDDPEVPVNPYIAAALRGMKPKTLDDVAVAYQKVYVQNKAAILAYLDLIAKPGADLSKASPAIAQLANYPWAVPKYDDIFDNEEMIALFNSRKFCEPWQNRPIYGGINNTAPIAYFRHAKINELRLSHPGVPAQAMAIEDAEEPRDSYVYIRGDKNKKGDVVPRRFLEALSQGDRRPYVDGSGRLEFARSVVDKSNPLTPRVAVNRFWLKIYGEGLVTTPDDFGNMSLPPSHPELLDYLAAEFRDGGWSVKKLLRVMVMSNAYRQDANPLSNPMLVKKAAVDPTKVDAPNRLLWHARLRRLDFEAIRDSLVVLTGKLNPVVGGQPVNITDEPFSYRRSLYGYVDRARLNETLTQFDYADPDAANSKRNSTIVPSQALFFMNNPISVEAARAVASRKDVANAMSEDTRVTAMYRAILQRRPSSNEIRMANDFITKARLALASGSSRGTTGASKSAVRPGSTAPRGASAFGTPVKSAQGAMKTEDESMMMATTTAMGRGGAEGVLRNTGEAVSRAPLTPLELLAQALILSNEFVYVN
ncbi:MAG: PSD1 and planctomycete cytochrome C domain-containing protein, partial [Opitutales bacterium]